MKSARSEAYARPAAGLKVALDIKGIAQALQRAGSATRSSKTFCPRGKFIKITQQQIVDKDNATHQVSEAESMDGGGGQIVVSVWGAAHHALVAAPQNSGVAIVGCNATLDSSGQVKLNIWPGAHVCATGVQVQSLT